MPAIKAGRRTRLLASISAAALTAAPGLAAAQATQVEEIIVTATRRDAVVQDVPINIAAVSGVAIERAGIKDLTEVVRGVPGIHVVDQGGRGSSRIVVRGLNADPLGSNDGDNSGGSGTVATYLGDIPVYIDLKLNDMDRVEVLLGPQGTLYGSGTLGGAIRYIPRRGQFGVNTFEIRADGYQYSEAEDPSTDVGITFNYSPSDNFAIRGNLDVLTDSGFIDYKYVVRTPGVSDADPDFTDPADVERNLRSVKDANSEDTTSGRLGFRFQPAEWLDMNLTYYFQFQDVGARQVSSKHLTNFPVAIGEYESALRYEEPNERDNQLLALEMTADLGFADLTSATALSQYDEKGQRDQTDLLITLEYSYEAFPTFSAFTAEKGKEETFNQELRLVSNSEGPLGWIVGAFYNSFESWNQSAEYTPGYAAFIGVDRPDDLEYFSVNVSELKEMAAYGELTYDITDAWSMSLGARYYKYDLKTKSAVDFPLFNGTPDQVFLDYEDGGQEDDGWLGKFNTSYKFTDDAMAYFTVSQGYRIGNSNGVGPCPDPIPQNQQLACALPNEMQYLPDKTLNYELGAKTQWFDKRLTLNGSLFYIQWEDIQVSSATVNGAIPITKNGQGAESSGVELNFSADVTEGLTIQGSYSYTKAELTDLAPALVRTIVPPGFSSDPAVFLDGEPGDRLPGSPEQQGSFAVIYDTQVFDGLDLELAWNVTATGDILTRTGGRGGGYTLDGYTMHNARIALTDPDAVWTVTLYANNLFDEYVETNARNTPLYNQTLTDADGGPVYVRSFYVDVAPPRQIGLRFSKKWGG